MPGHWSVCTFSCLPRRGGPYAWGGPYGYGYPYCGYGYGPWGGDYCYGGYGGYGRDRGGLSGMARSFFGGY